MATLWYRKPAELDHKGWEEDALPLGNGQLGCKVFGGISKERIQLNEKSLWSGTVLGVSGNTNGNGNGDFGKSFSQVRQLLKDGKMQEAKDAMGALQGDEVGLGAYQNMANFADGAFSVDILTFTPLIPHQLQVSTTPALCMEIDITNKTAVEATYVLQLKFPEETPQMAAAFENSEQEICLQVDGQKMEKAVFDRGCSHTVEFRA